MSRLIIKDVTAILFLRISTRPSTVTSMASLFEVLFELPYRLGLSIYMKRRYTQAYIPFSFRFPRFACGQPDMLCPENL